MSKNCIITTVKGKIKGNATSYIEKENEIFIPVSKKFTLKQTRAMAQDKVNKINKEYLSEKFGEVVSLNSSYTDGTGINIHPSQRLVEAYEVKEGNKTIEEVNRLDFFNGNVEQFKSWVDEFNSKKRTPLQPTEEQLKHIKPLPEKLIEQVNKWKNKSNKEILETLKLYAEVYSKDKELENLIQVLLDNVDKIKFVKFKGIGKLKNNNHQAEYDGETGEIFVNDIMYQPNNRDVEDKLYRTIIHEYLHGYFLSVLSSPTTPQEKELVEYIQEAYDVLTFEYEDTDKWYGFHDIHEFVSELLSNKEFRESKQVKKTGIIQNILNFINQLFFKKYGKNSIEIKQNTFNKILENISILEPSLVRYSSKKGSLSDFISQKSQQKLNQLQELFNENPELSKIGTVEQYSQYLDTIFPDSKVTEIDNYLYNNVLNQLEQENIIEKDCSGGKLKAEKGLQSNFTKGGEWKIYEIFEGKSHKQGGIDINIKNNQISFTNKNGSIKAKYGLVISKDNPNTKVKVNQNNQIKEYDISSPEYKDLYNTGKLMSYDKNTDSYIAPPLEEVTVTAESPQWMKDKEALEKEYSKDWYIDNILPKFSRSIGVSADNMHSNSVKQYNEFINNKLAEKLLKRNPKVGSSNNERLAWYNSLSEKERDIVNNSYSADKFSPAVRAYMESQSNEAKKYGILETFRDVDKLAQSVEGTPERFRIFPNAENNYENYVNPLMWIGDMAKGLGNVPKDIKEENYLKAAVSVSSPLLGGALVGLGAKTTGQFVKNTFLPLGGLEENIVKGGKNLVVDGLAGKLSKADEAIDAIKILNKIDNNSFYRQIGKEGYEDAIKTGVIRSKPIGEYAGKAPYFVEGKDFDKLYSTGAGAVGKKPEYIFEMPQLKNPEEMSAFRVNQQAEYSPYVAGSKEIPISQGKIYRLNNNNEYELVDATKAGSKVLNKTDDIVKNLPKLEQIPLDFKIEDVLKNISSTERKNMEIVKKGNAYFKELDNPESLKRLKEFGDEYNIDLLDAYKKAEQRWDYGNNIGKNDRFQVKKTDEDWYGLSTTNLDYEDELRLFDLKQKFGEDSKQVKDFYKDISQKKSINYISDVVPLDRYEKTIWHELSHDINKSIIDSSPKLQEDIKNIFTKKGAADINKVKKAREYVADDFYTKKDKVLKDLDNPEKLKEIGEEEFDYVTRPTETWAFLSTNLRQDLKNTGIIKNYNELLTPEKLEQAIKNGNTVFSRFEPYIKDKEAFIKLFNKMTLSIAPAALYLQSQNKNEQ